MRTLNDITNKRERQEEIIIESDIINRYHVILWRFKHKRVAKLLYRKGGHMTILGIKFDSVFNHR